MPFENLTEKLQNAFKILRGKGKLTEKDVKEAMREVKLALLEADVNFKIVKSFIQTVTEKSIGSAVLGSITPGQQVIKIVHEEMVNLLGSSQSMLTFSPKPPTVYMLVGLNGAGKTTTTAKLGAALRKQGKHPLLAACDVYRPAAIKQLQVLGAGIDMPVYAAGNELSPEQIAKQALKYAGENHYDVVILDTAGRFHVNDELMDELLRMKKQIRPQEILLVVDAMTGQDAVNVAETFNNKLGIDGVIMTKLDSDTRGGAALSVRSITGKPIKYAAMGEKIGDLEAFHPDRMAERILGMGDVLSLVEKAQQVFDEKEARAIEKKFRENDFNLEDFLNQMKQIKKMGPIKNIIGMIPGLSQLKPDELEVDESIFTHMEAIIDSMTIKERRSPGILNSSRKKRIARGSGRTIQEVNKLVRQFDDMKKMMKDITGFTSKGKKGRAGMPFLKF